MAGMSGAIITFAFMNGARHTDTLSCVWTATGSGAQTAEIAAELAEAAGDGGPAVRNG